MLCPKEYSITEGDEVVGAQSVTQETNDDVEAKGRFVDTQPVIEVGSMAKLVDIRILKMKHTGQL